MFTNNYKKLYICLFFFMGCNLFADAYPLDYCIVTLKNISDIKRPVSYNYKGSDIKFFNEKALTKFKKNPEFYVHKINKQIVEQQLVHYPTKNCIVSNEVLDHDSINIVHENRLVRLCCKGCVKDFKKNAVEYISKLDKIVIHQQKPDYPLVYCIVMEDEALGGDMGEPIDFVHANKLIRFCCNGCIKKFRRNPSKFMKKIKQYQHNQHKNNDNKQQNHEHHNGKHNH